MPTKNLEWTSLLFLSLLVSTPAFAFNCELLTGKAYKECKGLEDLGISEELHDLIVSDFVYSNNYFPLHSTIFNWNTELNFKSAPENVEAYNGKWIKNAWMKIVAVMPSVQENEILLVPENISILTPYYFEINVPDNRGECNTEYKILENTTSFDVFVNDNLIGHEKISQALINKDSQLSAKLEIKVNVEVKYYEWEEYCIDYEDEECVEYEYRCKFDYKETIKDQITINDNLKVNHYKDNLKGNLTLIDKYSNNLKIRPEFENTTSALIEFKDSYYYQYNYFYDIIYDYTPYFVLTLRSHQNNESGFENLFIEENDIIVKSEEKDCTLWLWNHFKLNSTPCILDNEIIKPKVWTDKLIYKENEKIKVYIEPQDKTILVSYGNQTKNITGSTEFNAKHQENKITAKLGEFEDFYSINVVKGNKLNLLFNFSVCFFLLFIMYRGAKIKMGLAQ